MTVSKRTAILVLAAIGVVAFGVVALLVIPAPHARTLPADPWSVQGPLVVTSVPVTQCPTSFGLPGSRDVRLPGALNVDVSSRLASQVAVFTDGLGTLDVLAPATWHCTALDAVDASSTLVVYPPGAPKPSWGSIAEVRSGIVASQTGGCLGCSLETACPIFPGARHAYVATYGVRCHLASERDEIRVPESPSKVLFIDPAGVLGAGRPSGGGFAAYGAMLWHLPGTRLPTAWLDTCTLPDRFHDLCVLSVRAFLARHPG